MAKKEQTTSTINLEKPKFDYKNYNWPVNISNAEGSGKSFIVFHVFESVHDKFTLSGGSTPVTTSSNSQIITQQGKDLAETIQKNVNKSQEAITGGVEKGTTGMIAQASRSILSGVFENKRRMTNASICLYMPPSVSISQEIKYESIENKLASGIAAVHNVVNQGNFTDALKTGMVELLNTSGKFGLNGTNILQVGMAQQHLAVNPHKEQIFQGVEFRTFDFSFTFAPKSASEAILVYNICNVFQFLSLPSMKGANESRFFIYPAEFSIEFHDWRGPNKWIKNLGNMVCTKVDVKHGNDSAPTWATLANGEPLETTLSLNFIETEIMTKDRMAREGNIPV